MVRKEKREDDAPETELAVRRLSTIREPFRERRKEADRVKVSSHAVISLTVGNLESVVLLISPGFDWVPRRHVIGS